MSNLTAREKAFMYAITLLIIIVLGYFFGIRTLNNKYDQYKAELNELNERKAYLDMLRENNASMANEIDLLKESCSELELSFIDKLETECIEQYILKTFEDAGCPYLVSIEAADVAMPSVTYPDGSLSPDGLLCLQINVSYSSTDGYTVTQYNRTPDFTNGAEIPVEETIADLWDKMGQPPYDQRVGYDEFIAALKTINKENPSCIKVNSIHVVEIGGHLILDASINFYATSLRNRISVDDSHAAYTYWQGDTNVDTKGGFIGFPYICDYEDSLWYGVTNNDLEDESKPFAAYWAVALFDQQLTEAGGDYAVLLNFEGAAEDLEATPTPEPEPEE